MFCARTTPPHFFHTPHAHTAFMHASCPAHGSDSIRQPRRAARHTSPSASFAAAARTLLGTNFSLAGAEATSRTLRIAASASSTVAAPVRLRGVHVCAHTHNAGCQFYIGCTPLTESMRKAAGVPVWAGGQLE
eukprot:364669-Chlamydomonas_euryale.AAC.3